MSKEVMASLTKFSNMKWLPTQPTSRNIGRKALNFLWTARNPSENYLHPPPMNTEKVLYNTKDGWESHLLRIPPKNGTGVPVIVATGPILHPKHVLLLNHHLIESLNQNGFDVYLFTHRGHREARLVGEGSTLSFDAVVREDLPCAIDAVKRNARSKKVIWIGHGLGGCFLYGWLGAGGEMDIAAGVCVDSPVVFMDLPSPKSNAFWDWLPITIPTETCGIIGSQFVQDGSNFPDKSLTPEENRSLLYYGLSNTPSDMARQMRIWHEEGVLCSLDRKINYLSALKGSKTPLFIMSGKNSQLSKPDQSFAILDHLPPKTEAIKGDWGLCPFIGQMSSQPSTFIINWLEAYRKNCWM